MLFDALERVLAGTKSTNLVNDLYQGALTDFVRCQACHKEAAREDTFLDLSLVLRPFGATSVTHASVAEVLCIPSLVCVHAQCMCMHTRTHTISLPSPFTTTSQALEYFLQPESLEGDNQYLCSECGGKRDAVKGLKLKRLPYLLALQLKRFDYDCATFVRVKLNDEVRFPLLLDLNKYMEEGGGEMEKEGKEREKAGVGGLPDLVDGEGRLCPEVVVEREEKHLSEEERSFRDFEAAMARLRADGGGGGRGVLKMEEDGVWEEGEGEIRAAREAQWKELMLRKKGPYLYELLAVLIHSGGALGALLYGCVSVCVN